MSLNHNKKALMRWIIDIALLLFAAVIIIGIWNLFFSKAEGAVAEQLCRGFNAARLWGEVNIPKTEITLFNLVPRTCKRLDKSIPSGDYDKTVQGTMQEMGYMVTRCWWQWLEGMEDNIFGKDWPFSQHPCFICYTFTIKKDISPIEAGQFVKFLSETQYIVKDTSDKCNVNGGGWCRIKKGGEGSCQDEERQIPSTRCPPEEVNGEVKDRVCCNKNIECLNKGGICSDVCGNLVEYDEWSCKGSQYDKCCIEKENFLSYMDYVQRYMGEGAVIIGIGKEGKFQPLTETYAVTYIPNTEISFWKTFLISPAIALAKEAIDAIFGKEKLPHFILVSKLSEVNKICAIEVDTSGL